MNKKNTFSEQDAAQLAQGTLDKLFSGNVKIDLAAGASVFQINGNFYAGDHIDYGGGKEKKDINEGNDINEEEREMGDETVKNVIDELSEVTDEKGKRIFCKRQLWYAVHRVLSDYCGYPTLRTQFCDRMVELGMDKNDPEVSYESIRKGTNAMLDRLRPKQWHTIESRVDEKAREQIVVAKKLMEMLGI